jgi:hypothetical protein
MAALGDTSMANQGGSRWLGWVIIIFFAVFAVALSIRETGMLEGRSGSYLGRTVADQPAANAQQNLSTRVRTQNY